MTIDQFIDLALIAVTGVVALAYAPGAVRQWRGVHSASETRTIERHHQVCAALAPRGDQ